MLSQPTQPVSWCLWYRPEVLSITVKPLQSSSPYSREAFSSKRQTYFIIVTVVMFANGIHVSCVFDVIWWEGRHHSVPLWHREVVGFLRRLLCHQFLGILCEYKDAVHLLWSEQILIFSWNVGPSMSNFGVMAILLHFDDTCVQYFKLGRKWPIVNWYTFTRYSRLKVNCLRQKSIDLLNLCNVCLPTRTLLLDQLATEPAASAQLQEIYANPGILP